MKQRTIALLVLADLVFLGAVGYQLWARYQTLQGQMTASPKSDTGNAPILPPLPSPPVVPPAPPEVIPTVPPVVAPAVPAPLPKSTVLKGEHKLRRTFVFFSPKAASVQLVGDFNQWTPQELRKKGSGRWEVSVMLSPGDFSYNFIVDGKITRDRNQPRTDAKGRSLLTVAP